VTPLSDLTEFQWIRDGVSAPVGKYEDVDWQGNPVSNVMPPLFDRYVKILHSLDAHYENIDKPLSKEELLILQVSECQSLRSFVERSRNKGEIRLRWREVAEVLKVPFESAISDEWFRAVIEPGCWPRFVYGPNDGSLDQLECSTLVEILARFDKTEEVYFKMADMHFYFNEENPVMFRGPLLETQSLLEDDRYKSTPEYWWPQDHSWCVCSNYDLTFTVVGGSDELCKALLADSVLESVEVAPTTRIDLRSKPQKNF
jgi:hypothetical protein